MPPLSHYVAKAEASFAVKPEFIECLTTTHADRDRHHAHLSSGHACAIASGGLGIAHVRLLGKGLLKSRIYHYAGTR